MNRRRRAAAKRRRELARRAIQLRPEGGPRANNGNPASSQRSRERDWKFLMVNHAPAPDWY